MRPLPKSLVKFTNSNRNQAFKGHGDEVLAGKGYRILAFFLAAANSAAALLATPSDGAGSGYLRIG